MKKVYKTSQAARMFDKLDLDAASSNHHIKGFLVSPAGKRVLPALYVNKGSKDIPHRIARKIKNALLLDDAPFDKLITCKMSKKEYYRIRFNIR